MIVPAVILNELNRNASILIIPPLKIISERPLTRDVITGLSYRLLQFILDIIQRLTVRSRSRYGIACIAIFKILQCVWLKGHNFPHYIYTTLAWIKATPK